MKKLAPYFAALILFGLLCLLVVNNRKKAPRNINERITLKQKDKIPYGTSVARTLLPRLFPASGISFDTRSPGNWDSLTVTSYNQAVVIVAMQLNADESELSRLLDFARQGNYVFIIAKSFSQEASQFFNFTCNEHGVEAFLNLRDDSLKVNLEPEYFGVDSPYVYPGRRYASSFLLLDTAHTTVLGRDDEGSPDFISFKTGNGGIFIHVAPLAFSNYFVLHRNNIGYFEKAFSVIPPKVDKIVWNEYYLNKPASSGGSGGGDPDWFRVLLRYPELKWGLLTGIGLLALLALLGSRRRQRAIPPYGKPRNDSLDFVRTMGRLYYDRGDHANLARKMAAYFLGHVRTVYKLPTHTLDPQFIELLHVKSGYGKTELDTLVSYIHYLEDGGDVSEEQLTRFHQQLESFYQNT